MFHVRAVVYTVWFPFPPSQRQSSQELPVCPDPPDCSEVTEGGTGRGGSRIILLQSLCPQVFSPFEFLAKQCDFRACRHSYSPCDFSCIAIMTLTFVVLSDMS